MTLLKHSVVTFTV